MLLSIGLSWTSFVFSISTINKSLVYFLGTTCLSANIWEKSSGTLTSALTFLLVFSFNDIKIEYKICIFLLLIFIHFVYYRTFITQFKFETDDPKIYTLDEALAINMAWIFLGTFSFIEGLVLFVFFRFFDIVKPFGILRIERDVRFSAEFRNLADDIIAMFYTLVCFQIIKFYVG